MTLYSRSRSSQNKNIFVTKNTMRIFLLIIILIGFGLNGTAQIKIAGTVNDGTNSLPFCNVVLYDLDSVIVTGEVTDDLGRFNLLAPAGEYILGISFIGFIDYIEEISLSKDIDKGIIIMPSFDNELEEVLVTAQKRLILRKPDRLIYNLSNSVAAQGSDMSEAIALAPGVTIQNGVVNMIGRGVTRVMINGRILQLQGEELLNYLSTIARDNIETIEVITNPPAKYEALGQTHQNYAINIFRRY
jgi:iron complex outermembrane receptor protein